MYEKNNLEVKLNFTDLQSINDHGRRRPTPFSRPWGAIERMSLTDGQSNVGGIV